MDTVIQFPSDTNLTLFLSEVESGYFGEEVEFDYNPNKGLVYFPQNFELEHPTMFDLMKEFGGHLVGH